MIDIDFINLNLGLENLHWTRSHNEYFTNLFKLKFIFCFIPLIRMIIKEKFSFIN